MQQRPHFWLRSLTAAAEPAALLSSAERRWCDQLPAVRRSRYSASRRLLRDCLAPLLDLAPEQLPLHSPPGRPPQLLADLGHLSLSHSGNQLLLAWSPRPIGVDLEWAERELRSPRLAERFFPAAEAAQLLALPQALRRRALLESWVRKEAAIKWQGSSLARDLRHWFWDGERRQLLHLRAGWRPGCLLEERRGWLCAAVGEAVEQGIWG